MKTKILLSVLLAAVFLFSGCAQLASQGEATTDCGVLTANRTEYGTDYENKCFEEAFAKCAKARVAVPASDSMMGMIYEIKGKSDLPNVCEVHAKITKVNDEKQKYFEGTGVICFFDNKKTKLIDILTLHGGNCNGDLFSAMARQSEEVMGQATCSSSDPVKIVVVKYNLSSDSTGELTLVNGTGGKITLKSYTGKNGMINAIMEPNVGGTVENGKNITLTNLCNGACPQNNFSGQVEIKYEDQFGYAKTVTVTCQ